MRRSPLVVLSLLVVSARAPAQGEAGPLERLPDSAWTREAAAHLLRRAGFGGSSAEIDALHRLGLAGAVDRLVDFESIDDYAGVRRLGAGGMGEVYLVVRKATGELAALKALRRCDRSGAESIVRFCREARTGHLLDHPNVIRYLDTGYARGLHYLVLEYGGGRTVRDVLVHKGRLGVRLGIQVAYQVSKALEHALTHDVVHRDIKPENILIDRTKTVRLLDLGLAKSMSESGLSGVTRPGTVLGSLAYSAPEQLEDARRADHRSDIYSLGVVLYEMVSGRRPIAGHSPAEIVSAVMSGRYSSIRDVAPDAPEELERILARAMARRPEDRYPDPTEMGAALKALYASLE